MAAASGTQEFAETLRELKERSRLSYGALAKRLHVSTSTLHRYCNGDAVPVEYAPVERLARLCGARPEELVALHRRWLLADAERRRGKGGGSATEATAGAATGAAVGAGGRARGAGEDEALRSGAPGEGDQAAVGQSEAGRSEGDQSKADQSEVEGSATGSATGTVVEKDGDEGGGGEHSPRAALSGPGGDGGSSPNGAASVAGGVAGRNAPGGTVGKNAPGGTAGENVTDRTRGENAADGTPGENAADGTPGGNVVDGTPGKNTADGTPGKDKERSGKPGRNKKLWAVLAGAAVVALVVPLAVHGAGTPTRHVIAEPQAHTSLADGRGPQRGSGPARSPRAAPSPSATHGEHAAKADSTPSATGSPAPSTSSKAEREAADRRRNGVGGGRLTSTPKGVPLTADVRMNNWRDPCGRWYLLDKPTSQVPPPPPGLDTRGWANALGAVAGGNLRIQVTVQGTGEEAVVLHALRVRVTGRTAPFGSGAYSMGDGCGGELIPASFGVDLDAADPLPRPVAGSQGDRTIPATDFPFKVSASDPQVLNIDAHALAHNVSWYLELEWSSGDRHGTLRLDDRGRPFRTSAMKGKPTYYYRPDIEVWEARQEG
ncbi:helix-turn-helix domain-containing protein [Streptomyces sp. NPDC003077]|uniref:helix-turn-helix domain-containing protein n=1 Tax=Streptomyces sp. NPDC003077 TaxID=3154443 RepID=UPI0033B9B67D